MLHLYTSGPFGMVFENLQGCFHLENSASGLRKSLNFVRISRKVTSHIKLHMFLERFVF